MEETEAAEFNLSMEEAPRNEFVSAFFRSGLAVDLNGQPIVLPIRREDGPNSTLESLINSDLFPGLFMISNQGIKQSFNLKNLEVFI